MIKEEIYHIYNKSIANFKIFNNDSDYERFLLAFRFFQFDNRDIRFCRSLELLEEDNNIFVKDKEKKLVRIVAYCIMPTHFHLILIPCKEKAVSIFTGNICNSYTRFFNSKYGRKGPLWEGRAKKVLVENNEQLIHLTRYLHLNPVTSYITEKPIDWQYSSYKEYIGVVRENSFCEFRDLLNMDPIEYRFYVNEGIQYQRDLAEAKK
ncbi:MAG: transposase [Candidatus Omnitrophota bacterium]